MLALICGALSAPQAEGVFLCNGCGTLMADDFARAVAVLRDAPAPAPPQPTLLKLDDLPKWSGGT
jgi:hypothetical protein